MASHKSTSPDRDNPLQAALRFAHASGAWVVPGVVPRAPATDESQGDGASPSGAGGAAASGCGADRLQQVREELGECTRCRLAQNRRHLVFGVGNPDADLVFVGEAPGAEEDRRGEPFVGRAGQLLDRMIRAIGLQRDQVYIGNVLKCRPPDNRDPGADEAATCSPFLWKQIDAIRPRVICALGAHAARNLLDKEGSIGSLRGRAHRTRGWIVVATYHPAYLLRSPSAKRKAWQDLRLVSSLLDPSA